MNFIKLNNGFEALRFFDSFIKLPNFYLVQMKMPIRLAGFSQTGPGAIAHKKTFINDTYFIAMLILKTDYVLYLEHIEFPSNH